MKSSNPWTERYEKLTSIAEIKTAATLQGDPLVKLHRDSPELAAERIENMLSKTFVPTDRIAHLIQGEMARAHAHAVLNYTDEKTILTNAYSMKYEGEGEGEGYMPTCFTGLAGSGKTQLRKALARILDTQLQIKLGPGHGEVPINTFTTILIGGQKSISQILRPLARPEVVSGKIKLTEEKLIQDCMRWQTQTGACLFGVDELQFLAQSSDATTQITKVLLALQKIRRPWFFVANYSLCGKLKSRPQEATQRLLSRPRVIFPDLPESKDWSALLNEYERLLCEAFEPKIFFEKTRLWNLTAGLKRPLVLLIKISYLRARKRGSYEVVWADVEGAFNSVDYQLNREDVGELIANSIQGGKLRSDLKCPFNESDIEEMQPFKAQLRQAHERRFVAAAVASTLSAKEEKMLQRIQDTETMKPANLRSTVVKLYKTKKTAKSLSDSARRFMDASTHNIKKD